MTGRTKMMMRYLSAASLVALPALSQAKPMAAGSTFSDCRSGCPEMVVVPAGHALLGSTEAETAREGVTGDRWIQRDKPQYRVTIARPFAIGRYEVTIAEYRRFAEQTRHPAGTSCWIYNPASTPPHKFEEVAGVRWTHLANWGFAPRDRDPISCVSWNDAQAYAAWLSRKTGKRYRLPSEGEWEYAARGGSTTARFWGDGREQACEYSNIGDLAAAKRFAWRSDPQYHFMCDDGFAAHSPVGSFKPNGFGLHDTQGNVYEWTSDCFAETNAGAPADGGARSSETCEQRSLRGGGFGYYPHYERTSFRIGAKADYHSFLLGFRLVRDVE
jgi:formylglycine-generating enzyme